MKDRAKGYVMSNELGPIRITRYLALSPILVILLILLSTAVIAETKVATDPTRISVGARVLGMGKSYLGRADDISSLFINPAGLASIKNWQVTSMSGKFINEFNYLNLGYAYPTRFGTFAFGFTGSDISFSGPAATLESIDGVRVVPSTVETVSYGYNNSVMLLGYGVEPWKALSVGVTMKMFSPILTGPQITGGTARGFDMDVGMLYEPSPALRLGVTVQNALPYSWGGKIQWGNGVEESFPSTLKTGLSVKLIGKEGLRRVGKQELKFNFDGDFTPLRPNIPSLYHLGLEWSPVPILDLRTGIDQDIIGKGGGLLDVSNNFTAGVGIFVDGFRFDYAFHQYYGLVENDTHYFSLSYGIFREVPEAAIKERVHIVSPADRTTVHNDQVKVQVQAVDQAVDRVLVNGIPITASQEGFSETLVTLNYGKNLIIVQGLDKEGRLLEEKQLRLLRLISFTDVERTYWARAPIEALATLGYIQGYPGGIFRPDRSVNRAEFAAVLSRIASPELKPERVQTGFADVSSRNWASAYIRYAARQRFMQGYPGQVFKPAKDINRAEGVVTLARFAKLPQTPIIETPFPDVPGRYWAFPEIYTARSAGILKYLEGGRFSPLKILTRGEVAEMLSRTPPITDRVKYLLDFEQGFEVK